MTEAPTLKCWPEIIARFVMNNLSAFDRGGLPLKATNPFRVVINTFTFRWKLLIQLYIVPAVSGFLHYFNLPHYKLYTALLLLDKQHTYRLNSCGKIYLPLNYLN